MRGEQQLTEDLQLEADKYNASHPLCHLCIAAHTKPEHAYIDSVQSAWQHVVGSYLKLFTPVGRVTAYILMENEFDWTLVSEIKKRARYHLTSTLPHPHAIFCPEQA